MWDAAPEVERAAVVAGVLAESDFHKKRVLERSTVTWHLGQQGPEVASGNRVLAVQ